MADFTQLTGAYSASWLPWLMIPLIFYILPFPIFALVFLLIEKEDVNDRGDFVESQLTSAQTTQTQEG